MIKRFMQVTDKLYRGSAPSVEDVVKLHKAFGIKRIVSLDEMVADKIHRITQILGIEHVIIPINGKQLKPIVALVSLDLKKLLLEGGPTYVHCLEGKDRTGMVVAMVQCKYLGMSCKEALQEAHRIGFGIGLEPSVAKLYADVVKQYCKSGTEDKNEADIVDNSRPHDDYRGSVLDAADMSSFAPYLAPTRMWPANQVYDYKNDQAPTRNNFDLELGYEVSPEDKVDIPMVGAYDNDNGINGLGPVDKGGGFVNV